MTAPTLEQHVQSASDGDAKSLDLVLRSIKDDIYGLAIRMLWHPADAEDATQEILVKVATNLGSFEGRSRFRTWVYRVAVRSLLNAKRGRAEQPLSFGAFGRDLLDGLDPTALPQATDAEHEILKTEIKIACTQAMLLCLDRDHRIAYLLGEILGLSSNEAADCMAVNAPTYRKRLSRARQRVEQFTKAHCGIVNSDAPCRCDRRIKPAIDKQRIDPERLLFARHPASEVSQRDVEQVVVAIGRVCDTRSLMRSNPRYAAPESVLGPLRELTD